jgi:hypothetical protein
MHPSVKTRVESLATAIYLRAIEILEADCDLTSVDCGAVATMAEQAARSGLLASFCEPEAAREELTLLVATAEAHAEMVDNEIDAIMTSKAISG